MEALFRIKPFSPTQAHNIPNIFENLSRIRQTRPSFPSNLPRSTRPRCIQSPRHLHTSPASRQIPHPRRPLRSQLLSSIRQSLFQRRHQSTTIPPPPKPPVDTSLSGRLRTLSREYGWSAFGVYLLFTALDFPFCFAAVRYIGPDRVGRAEHVITEYIASVIPEGVKQAWRQVKTSVTDAVGRGAKKADEEVKVAVIAEPTEKAGFAAGTESAVVNHGIAEAEAANDSENASIWTQLALAYAIHKSFIFIRIPLTIAATPKVVKVLRGWGWDIGRRSGKQALKRANKKAAKAAKAAEDAARKKI